MDSASFALYTAIGDTALVKNDSAAATQHWIFRLA
jgi:hypothetical protein